MSIVKIDPTTFFDTSTLAQYEIMSENVVIIKSQTNSNIRITGTRAANLAKYLERNAIDVNAAEDLAPAISVPTPEKETRKSTKKAVE